MRKSARSLFLLFAVLLVASSLPSHAQLFKKTPSMHNVKATAEDGPELIVGAGGPVIRFTVGHHHSMSLHPCVGYLDISPTSIKYEVLAPAEDRTHSFEIPRSELLTAKQWFSMRMIEVKPKSGEKYHMMHLRRDTLEEVAQNRLLNINVLEFAEILQAIHAMPEFVAELEKRQAALTGGRVALAREAAAESLRRRPQDLAAGGIFSLESELTFNVLDSVYFDPASGQISLIGHRERRYAGPRIPYLQHLATLLDSDTPEFTLTWTPESEGKVDEFLERKLSPAEEKRVTNEWSQLTDATGKITQAGRYMLPALGVYPAENGSVPGYLGAQVAPSENDLVVVTEVLRGSPAEMAGLSVGDVIVETPSGAPLQPVEFMRGVAFAGAGSKFPITVLHEGRIAKLAATLGRAPGDPWKYVERNDIAEAVLRATGRTQAARVAHAVGTALRLQGTPSSKSALLRLLEALDLLDKWNQGERDIRSGVVTQEQAIPGMIEAICQRLDSSFDLAGAPVTSAFRYAYRKSRNPFTGMEACFGEMDNQSKGVAKRAVDELWRSPGGIQIAPELVEASFGVHPEVRPEYFGFRSDSQLARVMFEADYLGKRMMDMPRLKNRIPRYQTGFEFANLHPSTDRKEASYHMWISIAKIDAAQSREHNTLEFRGVKMQFNIREKGAAGRDLPPEPGGYEELLTSMYDDLAVEFPVLHELRETAKLSLAARWMRARQPNVKLPVQGRTLWEGPKTVPGLVYVYLHPHTGGLYDTTVIASGGAVLNPFPRGNRDVVLEDTSVVDLRPVPRSGTGDGRTDLTRLTVVPQHPDSKTMSQILHKKIEVPMWHPDGWVARATKGETRLQAINVKIGEVSEESERNAELRKKLEAARRVAQQLAMTERTINLLNSRNPERQQEATKLKAELDSDMEEFTDSALSIVGQSCLDMREHLKPGTLQMTADGVDEINGKLGSTLALIDAVKERDEGKSFNAAIEGAKEWGEELEKLAAIPAAKALRPFKAAQEIGDIYNVGKGFLKLQLLSEDRVKALESGAELDSAILKKHVELQKELSDRLDQMLRDPLLQRSTAMRGVSLSE